jgi:serine/threonine protein kinase
MQFKWDNIPYMAPEVVKNIGPSRLSDVWSVGCIVIEMITGKKAWSSLGS